VGNANYSFQSLGGDPVKTTNILAWALTVGAPEHWSVIGMNDAVALHTLLSPEQSLIIQDIMKIKLLALRKPLMGKWVDSQLVVEYGRETFSWFTLL
jgi:hypothetical protein